MYVLKGARGDRGYEGIGIEYYGGQTMQLEDKLLDLLTFSSLKKSNRCFRPNFIVITFPVVQYPVLLRFLWLWWTSRTVI